MPCSIWTRPRRFVVFLPETGKAKWKHTGISESRVLKGKKRVKHCSLGQNDAYVVLWADGAVTWAVDHNYPELEKILQNTNQGDVVVCTELGHFIEDTAGSDLGIVCLFKSISLQRILHRPRRWRSAYSS